MVNYKRVVCEVALLVVMAAVVAAAPAYDHHDCTKDKHYDQRQNGTENYRLNIDGVVIAVAPAESFLAAATDIDIGDLLEEFNELQKPKPPAESPHKPEESKPDVATPPKPQDPAPVRPLSDVSVEATKPETKGQKKDAGRKQIKGQRLKTLLSSMLVPLLRRAHTHEN